MNLTRRQRTELLQFAEPLAVVIEKSEIEQLIATRASQLEHYEQVRYVVKLEIQEKIMGMIFRSFFEPMPSNSEIKRLFKRLDGPIDFFYIEALTDNFLAEFIPRILISVKY